MWFEAMARLWDLTLRNGVVVRTAMDSDCFRRRKIQVSPLKNCRVQFLGSSLPHGPPWTCMGFWNLGFLFLSWRFRSDRRVRSCPCGEKVWVFRISTSGRESSFFMRMDRNLMVFEYVATRILGYPNLLKQHTVTIT